MEKISSTKNIKKFWDSQAETWVHYDGLFGSAKRTIFERIETEIKPHLNQLTPKSKILNLGAGANNESYFNEEALDNIIAVDFSSRMLTLNQATDKILADINHPIPVANNTIDLCTSFFLFRYLSLKAQKNLFQEIFRTLKINSWFVMFDLEANQTLHQKSKFKPNEICNIADQIGFSGVQGEILLGKYEYSHTPRGGWGGKISFTDNVNLGIVKGYKA